MENPVIPGRIQIERFILVKLFQKKGNTFRGGTYFPLVPKRSKFVGETNFDIWTYPTTPSQGFASLTVSGADGTADK